MKKCRRALFAFLASDYQAAQAWLEEQDRRGWELQSLSYWLPTARSPRPGRTSGTAWT